MHADTGGAAVPAKEDFRMKFTILKHKRRLTAMLTLILVLALPAGAIHGLVMPTRPAETDPGEVIPPQSTLLDGVYERLGAWSDYLLIYEIENQYNLNLLILVLEPQNFDEPFDYAGFEEAVFDMFDQEWFQYGRVYLDFISANGLRAQVNDFDMIEGEWYQHDFDGDEEPDPEFGTALTNSAWRRKSIWTMSRSG